MPGVYADATNDYERGWKDADHFFWVVPDGCYRVRGNNCITDAMVEDGKVTFKAVGAGNKDKDKDKDKAEPAEKPKAKAKK